MAQTLIARVRGQLSSKLDDYFDDLDLLDYLNEAQQSVTSHAIKLELAQPEEGGRTVRALDLLRQQHVFSALTFTQDRFSYRTEVDLTTDLQTDLALLFIGGEHNRNPIKLSEITPKRKQEIAWGLLFPTPNQGYYEHRTEAGKRKLLVWTTASSGFKVTVDYIDAPTPLMDTSTDLAELPDRLINAVVLKAALQAGVQEIRENAADIKTLYETEIATHLW